MGKNEKENQTSGNPDKRKDHIVCIVAMKNDGQISVLEQQVHIFSENND